MFCLDEDAPGDERIAASLKSLIDLRRIRIVLGWHYPEISYVTIGLCFTYKVIVWQPPIIANLLITCYAMKYEIS